MHSKLIHWQPCGAGNTYWAVIKKATVRLTYIHTYDTRSSMAFPSLPFAHTAVFAHTTYRSLHHIPSSLTRSHGRRRTNKQQEEQPLVRRDKDPEAMKRWLLEVRTFTHRHTVCQMCAYTRMSIGTLDWMQ